MGELKNRMPYEYRMPVFWGLVMMPLAFLAALGWIQRSKPEEEWSAILLKLPWAAQAAPPLTLLMLGLFGLYLVMQLGKDRWSWALVLMGALLLPFIGFGNRITAAGGGAARFAGYIPGAWEMNPGEVVNFGMLLLVVLALHWRRRGVRRREFRENNVITASYH